MLGNRVMPPIHTLPKTILSSPSQNDVRGSLSSGLHNCSEEVINKVKFDETIEKNISALEKEQHMKRLKSLRTELDFLQTTAWQYPSIDHYIGQ